MSYKFKTAETFAEGLHRIAGAQIEIAAQCLEPGADIHKGVHEARKTFKRLRALLALYQDALAEDEFRDLNHQIRDIARALAGMREIQAMLDSLGQLEQRFGRGGHGKVLKALRVDLEAKRLESSLPGRAPSLDLLQIHEGLGQVAHSLAHIRVQGDGFEMIDPGLRRTYRAARHWHEQAYALDRSETGGDETFHEWRKALQRHWRHMQLLTPGWPNHLRARAQLAHEIAETIGQDHDLAMLDQYLEKSGRALGPLAQVRVCRGHCRQLQGELRQSVHSDGKFLFLEGAKAFSRRIEVYWSNACHNDALQPRLAEAADAA
jgi:CHAD domain-containing protein